MYEPALDPSTLVISTRIGAGKFAHIHKGVLSGEPVAVKKQVLNPDDDRDAETVAHYLRTEAAGLHECGTHANVLALRGWLQDDASGIIWLVRIVRKLRFIVWKEIRFGY
jgi:hypothetical protein